MMVQVQAQEMRYCCGHTAQEAGWGGVVKQLQAQDMRSAGVSAETVSNLQHVEAKGVL